MFPSLSPPGILWACKGKHTVKKTDTKSGCRWTGRQTDGLREGEADFHWLLEVAVPRLGHGHPSLTVSAAQALPVAEIWRSKG